MAGFHQCLESAGIPWCIADFPRNEACPSRLAGKETAASKATSIKSTKPNCGSAVAADIGVRDVSMLGVSGLGVISRDGESTAPRYAGPHGACQASTASCHGSGPLPLSRGGTGNAKIEGDSPPSESTSGLGLWCLPGDLERVKFYVCGRGWGRTLKKRALFAH